MIEIMGWNMNRSVGTRKARINETCHPPAHPMQNIQQTTRTTSGWFVCFVQNLNSTSCLDAIRFTYGTQLRNDPT
jgi:hypothetical protein